MRYNAVVAAGAFTSVLTASAFGADLPTHKTPPAPVPVALPYNWTGCYIGGNVGGLWADKNFGSLNNSFLSENGPGGQNVQGSGVLIGGQLGCNYQVGQWVFGAQVDEDWTNASGSGTQSFGFLAPQGAPAITNANASPLLSSYNLTNHFQVNSLGSATARVGWAFDRFLPYIKGGVGWETVNYSQSLSYGSSFAWSQSWGETLVGWTVGGGFEYAFTDHLTAFAEGDYYDFGSKDLNACVSSGSCISFGNYTRSVRETDWVGKVGLNWKF